MMGSPIRQWIATITCSLCVAMAGSCFFWMSPLMVTLTQPNSPIPMTPTDTSWLSAFTGAGEFITSIPAGLLADRWGRKTVMMIAGPLTLLSWVLVIATKSIPVLYLVRFLHGIAVAIAFGVAPMYLAEVAEPKIRGALSGQAQTMWYAGALFAYVAGSYLSYVNYAIVSSVIPVLSFVLFFFVPESPYYLLMVKQDKKAKQALEWLRGDNDVTEEFENAKLCVVEEMSHKGGWKDIFANRKYTIGFFIVQLVCVIKCLNGQNAIMVYATQTFQAELESVLEGYEMSILLCLILVITTFGASLVTDKIGRKPLLIISSAGAAFFNLVIAVIFYLDSHTTVDVSSYKWISYVSFICFAVISNTGLGPLLQTIQAEYFPSHTRGIGGGITEMVASITTFVNVKQYQPVIDTFGVYMNYVIFAIVSLVGTVLFSVIITETSGQTLGEIQDTFEGKTQKKNDTT